MGTTVQIIAIMIGTTLSLCFAQRDQIPPPENATIDQLISQSTGGMSFLAGGLVDPTGSVLAELDLYLTKEQYQDVYQGGRRKRKKRKATSNSRYRWPDGIMPYVFAEQTFPPNDIYMIKVSMREWEKYTCVLFKERTSSDRNYVIFQNGFGCNSQLGMVGGGQALNLDRSGCRFKGLYLHEIGHALGLIHEHQRPIRDKFIEILYQNALPAMRQWFQKYDEPQVRNFDVDYEYSSVMHYGVTAFSESGQPTIRAKYPERESEIGRVYQKELSFTDVEIVNSMYGCSSHCGTAKRCEGGYLDQNCACICPDGTSDCEVGKTKVDPDCRNEAGKDWICNIWSKQGECERSRDEMNRMCPRACGVCTSSSFQEPAEVAGLCKNFYSDQKCDKWKENGDCLVNERWMRQNCKKSCDYCEQRSVPKGSNCLNAYNNDTRCQFWALNGECVINPDWMPINCQRGCRTCPSSTDVDDTVTRTTPRQTAVPTQRQTRPPVITTTTITPVIKDNCRDEYSTTLCQQFEQQWEFCTAHPKWMNVNCKETCGQCVKETADKKFESCRDQNAYCDVWANNRQCVANPSYMLNNCKRACNVCATELGSRLNSSSTSVSGRSAASKTGCCILLTWLATCLLLVLRI